MSYSPDNELLGGFGTQDGTIDFYARINSILSSEMTVLDLGAGRGGWFEIESCPYRRGLRTLKGKARKLMAVDVDPVVLQDQTADECRVMTDGRIPLEDGSVDVVIADYVLEHVEDVTGFVAEVNRVLKDGGYFCARTPHRWNYVSLLARLISNARHASVLRLAQPDRRERDVLPTAYRMNTVRAISSLFRVSGNFTFIYRSAPAYFFGSRLVYRVQGFLHRIVPVSLVGNIFVFLRK